MNKKAFPIGSYVVIFVSQLKESSAPKYYEMAQEMHQLAVTMDGFLGIDSSARDAEYQGITISYWRDLESIKNWKNQSDHLIAQQIGKREFYQFFHLEVAKIEKSYDFLAQD